MPILQDFRHTPGAHCGSTALADVARFHGLAFTEPQCFGIGEGLGLAVVEESGGSPSHLLMGRSRTLERRFFENLGVPFGWVKEADDARAWEAARAAVDANIPLLLRTDLHYLHYYKSKTHFTGHVVVLGGYDEERGEALLADTQFPGLQSVQVADLARARTSSHGMQPLRNHAFPVERLPAPPDLAPVLRRAIAAQAREMLDGKDLGNAKTRILGMEHLAKSFPAWGGAPDWSWCARFAYQIIEKRGTGGGNFRKLYASFLSQSAATLPDLPLEAWASRMTEIAEAWTALAEHLKALSEANGPDGFEEAAARMGRLAVMERAFFEEAAGVSP
ncbi:MAG: BtrH N-terminal domain-containing protein [Deltaproteobacteria bacterium]|nr:BtrH N-terminal domain-containing protein [Deltaproteobacteria bacterium]